MLLGHVETTADRVDHLLQLRQLQDETGGFQAFVPLVFHPQNTRLAALPKASSLEQLRTLAVSRLMLDNFPHVKAYWVSLGVGVAQVALGYGADDLDGTSATAHPSRCRRTVAAGAPRRAVAGIGAPRPAGAGRARFALSPRRSQRPRLGNCAKPLVMSDMTLWPTTNFCYLEA